MKLITRHSRAVLFITEMGLIGVTANLDGILAALYKLGMHSYNTAII